MTLFGLGALDDGADAFITITGLWGLVSVYFGAAENGVTLAYDSGVVCGGLVAGRN
jgi:hypothetical protein